MGQITWNTPNRVVFVHVEHIRMIERGTAEPSGSTPLRVFNLVTS